ncbi:hypothetical protein SAMN02745116_01391 [Pilibacter termitis]|uniref:Uncharacterized protein n=1 Tax=Pilibacter termitis TaxID=263852 RepID=A0A1T4NDE2_9ENTE|nr:hypothetical protein [Pilibacter termitis]SJZ77290.1 hypothetical protein SAMN02745116_01391 [Pilibacter termitis]
MTNEEEKQFEKRSDIFKGMLRLKVDTFRVWKEFHQKVSKNVFEDFDYTVKHWKKQIRFYNQSLFDDYMKRVIDSLMEEVNEDFDNWYIENKESKRIKNA